MIFKKLYEVSLPIEFKPEEKEDSSLLVNNIKKSKSPVMKRKPLADLKMKRKKSRKEYISANAEAIDKMVSDLEKMLGNQ